MDTSNFTYAYFGSEYSFSWVHVYVTSGTSGASLKWSLEEQQLFSPFTSFYIFRLEVGAWQLHMGGLECYSYFKPTIFDPMWMNVFCYLSTFSTHSSDLFNTVFSSDSVIGSKSPLFTVHALMSQLFIQTISSEKFNFLLGTH